jgi:outer membrane protein OmpA-like peptidoglycan-associated protein
MRQILQIYLLSLLTLCFSTNSTKAQELFKDISDGRYTLGDGKNSFFYGFPYNYSTSHFIVNCGGRVASNSPNLHKIKYLTGEISEKKGKGSLGSEVRFDFAGFDIVQRIEPCDKDLKLVSNDVFAKFYKISYCLTNRGDLPQEASLTLLLDVNVHGNDRAAAALNTGKAVKINEQFTQENMPEEVIFLKSGLSSAEQFSVLLNKSASRPPQNLCIGHWPYLMNVFDFTAVDNTNNSYDTSMMLQWKSSALEPRDSVNFVLFVGSKYAKELSMQVHKTEKQEQVTIYFDKGKSELSENAAYILQNFITGKRPKAVLVEGFADATGSEEKNLILSEQRIENVSHKLQMYGVAFEKILKKSYGEFFAHQYSSEGEKDERKVIVTFWK